MNLKKTQVLVFHDESKAAKRKLQSSYMYKGESLDIVDQYTYLGLAFSRRGKWVQAKTKLLTATKKAMFAMQQRTRELGIKSPMLQCSLFDSLVSPVLPYGCEIWAVDHLTRQYDDAENLHRAFLRRLIGVRKSVPKEVLLAEFGRLPLCYIWQKLVLRYFNRLAEMPETRLLRVAFDVDIDLDKAGFSSWSSSVHK